MIMKTLFFFFLLIIAVFLFAAMILFRLFRQLGLGKLFKLFGGQVETGRSSHHTTSDDTKRRQRKTETSDGDIIIDRRNPEQVNQKIFHKNEGEYVHFEEE